MKTDIMRDQRRRRTDKIALVAQLLTALIAVIALVISLVGFSDQLSHKASKTEVALIQKQRVNAAIDSCYLVRTLVLTVYTPKYFNRASQLLKAVGLSNCLTYSMTVISHPSNPKEGK